MKTRLVVFSPLAALLLLRRPRPAYSAADKPLALLRLVLSHRVGLLTSFAITLACPLAFAGTTLRVSVASEGTQGNGASSGFHSISAAGRYVVFESIATNLVSDDLNGVRDVFVHDVVTGVTTRVSVSWLGEEANGFSAQPAISGDGRYVVFESGASNLVSDDANGVRDIFLRDRTTGTTTRVSVSSNGAEADQYCYDPNISSDGHVVAFISPSRTLVPGAPHGGVFVRDLLTGTTELASVTSSGEPRGGSGVACLSTDGRFVTFISSDPNIVPGDTNNFADIFVHDRVTGTTERVSVSSTGAEGNSVVNTFAPISADGRYVAFSSLASNLVPDDHNGAFDVFVRDRIAGTTERANVSSTGAEIQNHCFLGAISGDGRWVAFSPGGNGLVPGISSGVFVHDRLTGQNECVSVSDGGVPASAVAYSFAMSADAVSVAFYTADAGLVHDDTNGVEDMFVRVRSDLPVPTVLQMFTVDRLADWVEIRWRFADLAEVNSVRLERAESLAGPWILVAAEPRTEDATVVVRDASAIAVRSYWYRLLATWNDNRYATFGPLAVGPAQTGYAVQLRLLTANPMRGPIRVEFGLPQEADVELALLDIAGRRVAVLFRGSLLAGTHEFSWGRHGASPGVYFLRLSVMGQRIARRFTLTE